MNNYLICRMQTKFFIAFLLMIFTFIHSCKEKEEDLYQATITGVLMDSCEGKVLSGETIEFWDQGRDWDIFNEEIKPFLVGTFTTDKNGKFTVKLNKRLTRNVATIRHHDFPIAAGVVLDGVSTQQDLGVIYTHPFTRPITFRFTKGSDFDPNDKIAVYQAHSGGIYRDTFVNLSGEKKGVLYFEGRVYYSTKGFYDLAKDSIIYDGFASFKYINKSKTESVHFQSEACDTSAREARINF